MVIYLIIGVLLPFIHPEIADMNPILRRVYRPTIDDYIEIGKYNPMWKRLSVVVLIRFVFIVIGPVVTIIDLNVIAFRKGKNIILRQYEEEDFNYLYFSLMKGAGEVSCMLCTYSTKLTGYIDGGHGSDWNQKGYQCQSCGRLHEIEYPNRLDDLPKCNCGGEITRGEWLFCPECRNNHMIYDEQYIAEESK